MPAGASWGEYLKFLSCAMVSMMAGSQLVHMYYKPLDDLKVYIEREMDNSNATATTTGTSTRSDDSGGENIKN